ncbi:MAG: hypothetical protein KF915_18410 [Polyangiaceae bacterium]|nr:hypothetical protein [Polyangiaceae bacterium]
MSLEEQIKPFQLVTHDSSISLIMAAVGSYKQHIFDEREEEGFEGGGHDWQSLAVVFLEEKLPHLQGKVDLDSESSMFCVYSKDRAAIEEFAVAFHALCEDEAQMRDLFSRAELD